MAQKVSAELLRALRTSSAAQWATPRLSNKCILWQGIADWPQPDIAFEDPNTGATLALEFKPPNQSKREYVTGVGQMLTYLQDFEFAGLVLPERSHDGFAIAEYIENVFQSELSQQPVVLMSYGPDVCDLSIRRALTARVGPAPAPRVRRRGTFWAYWRDLSNYDLFALLKVLDAKPGRSFDQNFHSFWISTVLKGKAKNWEGQWRKKSPGSAESPERLNAKYAMRHCGLIGADGSLTSTGLELLQVGKIYGPESDAFNMLLAKRVLVDGNHLELILWVEAQTRDMAPRKIKTSDAYLAAIDAELVKHGIIPPRPAGAVKPHFFRDEAKLWNKLGLLQRQSPSKYFRAGEGYRFDWRMIISAVQHEGHDY
ncbi:hypothetical protein M9980_10805 [Sphingomonas donggukensis]|uniref:Uncharacterized protein n=1 Tax=Sphingomonas donggukensis TaxID=2949093 RepID=A0ABY4TTJ7_9SPHN|nr:hypothetical protein [Sphingomonas donggukensis]URW75046.1 hypothetical protein M9980_10805 [Sphingomonas donggukensis]